VYLVVYMPPYIPGYTMVGGYLPTYPGIPWWVYTSLYIPTLYTPGYTPYTPCTDRTPGPTSALVGVPGEEALGSKEVIPMGERLSGAFLLPFLLRLVGLCAESYSASRVNKVEGSDRRRVSSHLIPYG